MDLPQTGKLLGVILRAVLVKNLAVWKSTVSVFRQIFSVQTIADVATAKIFKDHWIGKWYWIVNSYKTQDTLQVSRRQNMVQNKSRRRVVWMERWSQLRLKRRYPNLNQWNSLKWTSKISPKISHLKMMNHKPKFFNLRIVLVSQGKDSLNLGEMMRRTGLRMRQQRGSRRKHILNLRSQIDLGS